MENYLKILIFFILGFLFARMVRGNGFMIGGEIAPLGDKSPCGETQCIYDDDCIKCVGDTREVIACQGKPILDYCNIPKPDCSNSIPEQYLPTWIMSGSCTGADLSGVDLTNASLEGANLSGVNLRDADLNGADLQIGE